MNELIMLVCINLASLLIFLGQLTRGAPAQFCFIIMFVKYIYIYIGIHQICVQQNGCFFLFFFFRVMGVIEMFFLFCSLGSQSMLVVNFFCSSWIPNMMTNNVFFCCGSLCSANILCVDMKRQPHLK